MTACWLCSVHQNPDSPNFSKKNYLVLLLSIIKFNFIFHPKQQAPFHVSSSQSKVFYSKKFWWVFCWFRSLQQRHVIHEIIKSAFYKGFYQSSNNFPATTIRLIFFIKALFRNLTFVEDFLIEEPKLLKPPSWSRLSEKSKTLLLCSPLDVHTPNSQ